MTSFSTASSVSVVVVRERLRGPGTFVRTHPRPEGESAVLGRTDRAVDPGFSHGLNEVAAPA
jgi:hypothetical protein